MPARVLDSCVQLYGATSNVSQHCNAMPGQWTKFTQTVQLTVCLTLSSKYSHLISWSTFSQCVVQYSNSISAAAVEDKRFEKQQLSPASHRPAPASQPLCESPAPLFSEEFPNSQHRWTGWEKGAKNLETILSSYTILPSVPIFWLPKCLSG